VGVLSGDISILQVDNDAIFKEAVPLKSPNGENQADRATCMSDCFCLVSTLPRYWDKGFLVKMTKTQLEVCGILCRHVSRNEETEFVSL